MPKLTDTGKRVYPEVQRTRVGPGPGSGGQSGDTQRPSDVAGSSSESVRELAEEGQFAEAEFVDAIENAPDAYAEGVPTREVPEDDVPPEYLDKP